MVARTEHRYVLAENNRKGVLAELGPSYVQAIRDTGLVDVQWTAQGVWRLIPRGRVGAVHVDGLEVVVTPKVGIGRLLFLLGYARDPGFRPETVEGIADDDLWPAVAETLCRHAERALAHGVLQGYVTEDAALNMVRGRIRIADQAARRPGMLLPLEVSFDEYTANIAENRLLRAAIRRTLGLTRIHGSVRARLRHLDSRLDGVTPLLPGAPLPAWNPSRLNVRYQPALRIAELVLRNLSFETGPGGLNVAAFVVDMAGVFEDFVTTALTEAWASYPGTTVGQFPAVLDKDKTIRMKVDIVHVVNKTPAIVADAKYKLAGSNGRYPNADHYQMLAYATALGVDTTWLIYADGRTPAQRQITNTPVTVVEYPLNLEASPIELLEQVAVLAKRAWNGSPTIA